MKVCPISRPICGNCVLFAANCHSASNWVSSTRCSWIGDAAAPWSRSLAPSTPASRNWVAVTTPRFSNWSCRSSTATADTVVLLTIGLALGSCLGNDSNARCRAAASRRPCKCRLQPKAMQVEPQSHGQPSSDCLASTTRPWHRKTCDARAQNRIVKRLARTDSATTGDDAQTPAAQVG
ncbi:hypothetical protein D3C84_734040 [compost metagenome]